MPSVDELTSGVDELTTVVGELSSSVIVEASVVVSLTPVVSCGSSVLNEASVVVHSSVADVPVEVPESADGALSLSERIESGSRMSFDLTVEEVWEASA